MYINSINNNNLNFKSRNAEIRFADDIARKVNQEFPRLSSSKIASFDMVKYSSSLSLLHDRVFSRIKKIREARFFAYNVADTVYEKLYVITSTIKKHKLGNCGESSQLSEIVARVNGIKDCFCAQVLGPAKHDFDHAVLVVKNNGKPYIIDAWLGFADYLPEASKRYQKEFRQHFDFNGCRNEKMYFDTPVEYDPTGAIFKKKYSEKTLRKLYPELIIKKVYNK